MRRALLAEAARLRTDRPLAVGAVLAVALAASVTLSLPEDLRAAPTEARLALFDALEPSMLSTAAVVAGLYGAFRFTADLERGVVARQLGFIGRLPLLGARAVSSMLGGAALAMLTASAGAVAYSAVSGAEAGGGGFVLAAGAVGAIGGLWGLAIGAVIGRHVPALFAVPSVLAVAVPLAAWRQEARLSTPLGAWLAMVGRDGATTLSSAPHGAALAAGAAWLVGAAALAVAVVLRRDVG